MSSFRHQLRHNDVVNNSNGIHNKTPSNKNKHSNSSTLNSKAASRVYAVWNELLQRLDLLSSLISIHNKMHKQHHHRTDDVDISQEALQAQYDELVKAAQRDHTLINVDDMNEIFESTYMNNSSNNGHIYNNIMTSEEIKTWYRRCEEMIHVWSKILHNIEKQNSFEVLKQEAFWLNERVVDYDTLTKDVRELSEKERQLRHEVKHEEETFDHTVQNMVEKSVQLMQFLSTLRIENEKRLQQAQTLGDSSEESELRVQRLRLQELRTKLVTLRTNINNDTLVNNRSMTFMQQRANSLVTKYQYWEEKLEKDSSDIQEQYQRLKSKRDRDYATLLLLRKRKESEEILAQSGNLLKNMKSPEQQRKDDEQEALRKKLEQQTRKLTDIEIQQQRQKEYTAQCLIRLHWRCYLRRKRQRKRKSKKKKKKTKKTTKKGMKK